ncbi:MAG: anti-sigma factor [Reyranellaceae bacterium]
MDCPTCETMVDAYVDGELSITETAAFEQALSACPECRRRLESARTMRGLLRDLPVEAAPDLLRRRIERTITPDRGDRRGLLGWSAIAASLLLALGLGWLGGSLVGQGNREVDELLAGYVRVAMSEHAVDVASSDRHTVKPWFAGRIDYAPPVHDLTAAGFPLIGGRIDVVDGRKVAVLVYRRNQHRIVLTVWPAAGASEAPTVGQRDGFALARWRHAGFDLRAVADIAPNDMAKFAAAVNGAIDGER